MATPTLGRSALARVDLVISQGSDLEYVLRYLNGTPPTPANLTGWTGKAQIRRSVSAEDVWLNLNVVVDALGYVTMTAPHTATEGQAWDEREAGVWDIELTDPSGKRVRLAEGAVRVSHEVTRA